MTDTTIATVGELNSTAAPVATRIDPYTATHAALRTGQRKEAQAMTTPPTSPTETPARITKDDRIALAAIDVANALPGKWTVGRGRNRDEAADVLCLATGTVIRFLPVQEPGAWRYRLVPGDLPPELRDVFLWYRRDEVPVATFAVGTPATEVATHIHQQLIPAFHQWVDRARKAQRERAEAHARQHEAYRQIAEQLESTFPSVCEPVHIYVNADSVHISLTMPIDAALARVPALAQALRADDATTAPSTPTETREKK
ncbi:hypothetical protein [Amycolatopsis sp. lyj-112]|uniref:hypothetical protein n=1 Tax=Amycolatopsis sp. lyj-112 TaxID=2789288 RepID=UPI0039788642